MLYYNYSVLFFILSYVIAIFSKVDHETGESLGFGFVKFLHLADAEKAMHAMNHFHISGKTLLVKPSNLSKQETDLVANTNLYIKPLPATTTEGIFLSKPYFFYFFKFLTLFFRVSPQSLQSLRRNYRCQSYG